MIWTPDHDNEIRRLAGLGLSASQIAEKLGAPSRNAVISRAHRKGIGLATHGERVVRKMQRPSRQSENGYRRPRADDKVIPFRPKPTPKPVEPPADCPAATSDPIGFDVDEAIAEAISNAPAVGVPLVDVPPHGCRYAVTPDDARPQLFCGAPAVKGPEGHAWCSTHRATVYVKPVKTRTRAMSQQERDRRRQLWLTNQRKREQVSA